MDSADFLFEEYKHLTDSFLRNEEHGKRQVNLFLTLTTTVIGAFAVIKEIFNTGCLKTKIPMKKEFN